MYLLNYTSSSGLLYSPCLGDSIQRARNFGNVCDSTINADDDDDDDKKRKEKLLGKKDCLY